MKHSFFIVGNPSSVWMREYIKEIHIKNGDEVYITVFDEEKLQYKAIYEDMGVTLVPIGKNSNRIEKIAKAFRLLKFALKHRKKERFDIVEIHYPPHNFQAYIISLVLKILNVPSFLMFWGSDILAINHKEARKLEKIVSCVTTINRLSEHTYADFEKYYGNKYDDMFCEKPQRFGTLVLPYINKRLSVKDKEELKKEYNVPNGKITVAIGYNGKRRQQHIEVLNELSKLEDKIKNKVYLILHLVGIDDEGYREEIVEKLQFTGIEYIIIDEMLEFEEMSLMRSATDVFIHAQTTDGLSGSIRECFCSETIVLNPTWIQYDEFEKIGFEYIHYDNFGELSHIVEKIVKNEIEIDVMKNKELVNNAYSWDSVYDNWIEMFDKMIDLGV